MRRLFRVWTLTPFLANRNSFLHYQVVFIRPCENNNAGIPAPTLWWRLLPERQIGLMGKLLTMWGCSYALEKHLGTNLLNCF